MNDSTITALAALATGLGIGPLLPKIFDAIATAFKRGGIRRKRDEAEMLRTALTEERGARAQEREAHAVLLEALRARLTRLLNRNHALRELIEKLRLQLISAGLVPDGEYPPINEDTDGP